MRKRKYKREYFQRRRAAGAYSYKYKSDSVGTFPHFISYSSLKGWKIMD